MTPLQSQIKVFFACQLSNWPEAASRFNNLGRVETKSVDIDGFHVKVQHNPARIVSTAAKVDASSVVRRPCFLCAANRPDMQRSIPFREMEILVNPFPIFPLHFTIPHTVHRPQLIAGQTATMSALSDQMPDYVIFYNGPRCGASAPDHLHFQAIKKDMLPIISTIENGELPPFGVIVAECSESSARKVENIIRKLPIEEGDPEPKVNILAYSIGNDNTRFIIIPRKCHRPSFYGTAPGEMLISPASIDLGGVIVAPRREDFTAIDSHIIKELFSQLCYTQQQVNEFINR